MPRPRAPPLCKPGQTGTKRGRSEVADVFWLRLKPFWERRPTDPCEVAIVDLLIRRRRWPAPLWRLYMCSWGVGDALPGVGIEREVRRVATVHDAVDSGDATDDDQVRELARWQLLDFEADEEDDYVSDVRLAVVCGCGRSGTTLARVILDSHPALFAGPESLLFLPTRIDFADLAWKFDLDEASLRELFARSRSRTEFIDRFQELLRAEARKQIWVDKTARNVHRLDYIWRHFPKAKVIHVVRDPRDVVASLKTHRRHKIEQGKIVPTGFCMPVEHCIARWKLAMDHALPHRGAPNYLENKYEAVVLDTEDTVRRLCDFIGVDFDRRMLDFHLLKTPTRDHLKFPQNVEATQPISTSPIGRHRMVLTADEIEQVEGETGSYMERLGYTLPQRRNTRVRVPVDPRAGEAPRIVTSQEVYEAIGGDPLLIKDWTREALRIHYEGKYIQPQKDLHRHDREPLRPHHRPVCGRPGRRSRPGHQVDRQSLRQLPARARAGQRHHRTQRSGYPRGAGGHGRNADQLGAHARHLVDRHGPVRTQAPFGRDPRHGQARPYARDPVGRSLSVDRADQLFQQTGRVRRSAVAPAHQEIRQRR